MANISIDDKNKDRKIIVNNFMRDLCNLDDDANKNGKSNVFSVETIWQMHLGGYKDTEYVKEFLREHLQENRNNEPFEFRDNERNVILTDAGRNRCDQYGI